MKHAAVLWRPAGNIYAAHPFCPVNTIANIGMPRSFSCRVKLLTQYQVEPQRKLVLKLKRKQLSPQC
ncbi:hypothetical protein KCP69_10250 [Salmonella enterica subsp. enterica]|nr:hypothetical protein KCP69_10250 [Salmonella enterica subsp. enterica]